MLDMQLFYVLSRKHDIFFFFAGTIKKPRLLASQDTELWVERKQSSKGGKRPLNHLW